jgi:hypothetical protein
MRDRGAEERATIRRLATADHKPKAWRSGRPSGYAYNCSCGWNTGLRSDARSARERLIDHLKGTK